MPIVHGAGYGPYTDIKQQHFNAFLTMHTRAVGAILGRWGSITYPRFVYVDLNAGPGILDDGEHRWDGSPLLFLDAAYRAGVKFDAFFHERNREAMAKLAATLREQSADGDRCTLLFGDNAETVKTVVDHLGKIHKRVHGLVYADPNGGALPIQAMRRIAAVARKIDFLVYASAAGNKRIGRPMIDDLRSVGRKHLLVREPLGQHQWTFVIMTDWADFPVLKAQSFHNIASPEGAAIAERLNWSTRERVQRHITSWIDDMAGTP